MADSAAASRERKGVNRESDVTLDTRRPRRRYDALLFLYSTRGRFAGRNFRVAKPCAFGKMLLAILGCHHRIGGAYVGMGAFVGVV